MPPIPPPRLLGPFDPLLLGWRSRDLVLDSADAVVTGNGIIRAIALIDGRAAGTWTMPGVQVKLHLWREQGPIDNGHARARGIRRRGVPGSELNPEQTDAQPMTGPPPS